MSMEICVLSHAQLSSISEWQNAIDTEGFPLRLSDNRNFVDVKGFLPAVLKEQKTGFECYHADSRELFETYDNIQFDREWKYVLAFVWGGNFTEMQAAWMAATAYARATAGVVFDEEACRILTASEAFEMVQDNARIMRN